MKAALRRIYLKAGLTDLPLLSNVDRPILVQQADGSYDDKADLPGVIRAPGIGPAGWTQAVLDLLKPAA